MLEETRLRVVLIDGTVFKTSEKFKGVTVGVEFVETRELKKVVKPSLYGYSKYTFCPRCIDDETYRHLLSVIESGGIWAE